MNFHAHLAILLPSQLIVERDKKIEGDKRTFPVAFVVKEGSR